MALKKHGLDPRQLNIDLELSSSEAIKAVVASGHGLTFLSRFVVGRELAQGILHTVPVRGLTIMRQLNFIYPARPRGRPVRREPCSISFCAPTGKLARARMPITSSYDI